MALIYPIGCRAKLKAKPDTPGKTAGIFLQMRTTYLKVRLCLILFLVLAASAFGRDIEKELNELYENKTFILREFHAGSHLKYDQDGTFISGGKSGTWTVDGCFKIAGLKIKKKRIELKGTRVYWGYNQQSKIPEYYLGSGEIRIDIKLRNSTQDAITLNRAIQNLFMQKGESLSDIVPEYWEDFLKRNIEHTKGLPPITEKEICDQLSRLISEEYEGGELKEPALKSSQAPRYTSVARSAEVGGTVVLSGMVNEDGRITVQRIVMPLGLGLEEAAIEALGYWKFSPAQFNGRPVPYPVLVNFDFPLR
jgi:TonB family protein